VRILVTNDDGVEATGLAALERAVRAREHWSCTTVAPRHDRSAISQGFTLRGSYESEQIRDDVYAVDGTPVDCVMFATTVLGPFDLVVSGINQGANLGWDCWYSGTVGAACEAVRRGCHAIAVSLDTARAPAPYYFGDVAEATASYLETFATEIDRCPHPATEVLNLNFPNRPKEDWRPLQICPSAPYAVTKNTLRVEPLESSRWRVHNIHQSRTDDCPSDGTDGTMVKYGPVLTRLPLSWSAAGPFPPSEPPMLKRVP